MDYQEASLDLIRLSGVDFRQSQVACPCCLWSGLAGQLRMTGISASDDYVRYACPSCESTIAMHIGLTDQEVLQEMERIRKDLAAELSAHPLPTGKGVRTNSAKIDFQAVRRQIAVSGTSANHRDGGASSPEEPAASNASADTAANNSRPAEPLRPAAPDFESVRRRMRQAETALET